MNLCWYLCNAVKTVEEKAQQKRVFRLLDYNVKSRETFSFLQALEEIFLDSATQAVESADAASLNTGGMETVRFELLPGWKESFGKHYSGCIV